MSFQYFNYVDKEIKKILWLKYIKNLLTKNKAIISHKIYAVKVVNNIVGLRTKVSKNEAIFELYKNGKLRKLYYKKNNHHIRETQQYYNNGNLEYSLPWKDGKINGIGREYYYDGVLKALFVLKDNSYNGEYIIFNNDSSVKEHKIRLHGAELNIKQAIKKWNLTKENWLEGKEPL
jgi:antitoxin component YwqK of YwqJK toxin-antitoxin module